MSLSLFKSTENAILRLKVLKILKIQFAALLSGSPVLHSLYKPLSACCTLACTTMNPQSVKKACFVHIAVRNGMIMLLQVSLHITSTPSITTRAAAT